MDATSILSWSLYGVPKYVLRLTHQKQSKIKKERIYCKRGCYAFDFVLDQYFHAMKDIQTWSNDYIRLLNKLYENEVTLIRQNLPLTLSLPRGGEISPPPTKIESYSFKDVSIFFNF